MVRVCATADCKISARFNHLGEQKGKFCSKHKEPGMVDIVHPHCKIEGCATLASFNMPGECRGEYCSQHKQVRPAWPSLPKSLLSPLLRHPCQKEHLCCSCGLN